MERYTPPQTLGASVPLRVLVVEDRSSDAELMLQELRRAGFDPDWKVVDTEPAYLASLESDPDVILADYVLPQFSATRALQLLQERDLGIPFVVVTGSVSEVAAVDCIKLGAADYLLKDRLARLGPAVLQALATRKARDETRRMQVALRDSEYRYRSLFEGVPIGLYRTTPDGQITDVNTALTEMLGYPDRESLLAVNAASVFVHPEDRQQQLTLLDGEGIVRGFESRMRRRDGNVIWVRDTVRVVGSGQGDSYYYQGSLEDITERKEMEEHLRRHERLSAVGQLAAGIAHDFRNLLTTIVLYAHMSLRKDGLPPGLEEYLHTIIAESKKATDLVQQMLDFSSRAMIRRRPLDLVKIIEGAVSIFKATIPENVHLALVAERDEFIVNADPGRIEQVLMNLAINARDAMPDGGDLGFVLSRLDVLPDEAPPVAGMPPGKWVCLAVTDTGTGMTDAVRLHLFEPFFTTKGVGEGTGLGLAQVYGIVRQHEGFIDVETSEGEGTTFYIYLPAGDEKEQSAARETALVPQGRGETILVVEDEGKLRAAASSFLDSLGYRVLSAANGLEAFALYDAEPVVDLVITDVVMPKMGGRELMSALWRTNPKLKGVAITGYAVGRAVGDLRAAGFRDVIHKPFDTDRLARIVRRVLDAE